MFDEPADYVAALWQICGLVSAGAGHWPDLSVLKGGCRARSGGQRNQLGVLHVSYCGRVGRYRDVARISEKARIGRPGGFSEPET